MGCDIHIYPEVRKEGKWQPAVPIIPHPNHWYDLIIDAESDKLDIDWNNPEYKKLEAEYKKIPINEILDKFPHDEICWHCGFDDEFDNRNYAWFAVLCGVRGDYDQDFGEAKGLPNNVSSEVKVVSDRDGVDAHSHHWITLRDLLDFEWNATIRRVGYFDSVTFRYQLREILSNKISYFPDQMGPNYFEISKDLMIKYLAGHRDFFDQRYGRYCVKVKQDVTYKQEVGEDYINKLLKRLSSFGEPEDVRIVFWFDN